MEEFNSLKHRCILGAAWVAFTGVCLVITASALASPRHFEIPAGDARVELNEFSQQADWELLFDFNQLNGLQTHAVSGDFEPTDALTQMLAGLPLTFRRIKDGLYAIDPAPRLNRAPSPPSRP